MEIYKIYSSNGNLYRFLYDKNHFYFVYYSKLDECNHIFIYENYIIHTSIYFFRRSVTNEAYPDLYYFLTKESSCTHLFIEAVDFSFHKENIINIFNQMVICVTRLRKIKDLLC